MPITEELGSVSSRLVDFQACSDQRPIHRSEGVASLHPEKLGYFRFLLHRIASDPNHGLELQATVRQLSPPATGRRMSGALASASSPDQTRPKRRAMLSISPPQFIWCTRDSGYEVWGVVRA